MKVLQDFVAEFDYEMPIDISVREKCQIGGNLASNAAGYKLMKTKSLHANTVGLKVVLPDGTILDNMTNL